MSEPQPEDTACCPICATQVPVFIYPDEKPDGTILGYARAECPSCKHSLTEDEIYYPSAEKRKAE